jgi:NADH:ubiquinone reductase (H+-translocating)
MEEVMRTTDVRQRILIAGAGYAGLHTAQRSARWLEKHHEVEMTLVDQNDYHQLITELPRVATGALEKSRVQIETDALLTHRVQFVQTLITGFDLGERCLVTDSGRLPYDYLVLALGSRPNDFGIPGLAEQVLSPYSAEEAQQVWETVNNSVRRAAATTDRGEQQRLLTIVIGGGGATGVELAGAFAEGLPNLAKEYGSPPELVRVILIEAGHTILAGSSPGLIARAMSTLHELKVDVRTNTAVTEAVPYGFRIKNGMLIEGGVFIWAGGVKAPELVRGSGLPVGYNGRIKVDEYLRTIEHVDIFVAGDLASVVDAQTGRALPVLAQVALQEGATVGRNLRATIEGRALEPFKFDDRGFVVSIGNRAGAAELAGITIGGRLARGLKDAIEWEYRQSVKHLHGFAAV